MRISDWSSDVCSSDLRGAAGGPSRPDPAALEGGGADHVAHPRLNLRAPARAVEHPVVADARLDVVVVVLGRNAATQIMRRLGLAEAADVVLLAFHRHQRRAADLAAVDKLAAMHQAALRQGMLLEHAAHGDRKS